MQFSWLRPLLDVREDPRSVPTVLLCDAYDDLRPRVAGSDIFKRAKKNQDERYHTFQAGRIRHTYASFAIAAGVNAKALSTYMGHANIGITLDRYGHLMPGNEAEAAGLLDAFLGAGAE